jgi:2-hydroxychromene-2-carboxylate isomerase
VIPGIEARTGTAFHYVPVLLGGIFKATGNASPAVTFAGIKNKPEYQNLEMRRFIAKHGITSFTMNPHFPVNTLKLMRGAIVADRAGYLAKYVDEMFRHMWVEPKKLDEVEVLKAALEESGLPADEILEGIGDPEIKQQLIANTDDAVARGVFGIPSFFVGDELFFGKDRLREVEEEIESHRGPSGD